MRRLDIITEKVLKEMFKYNHFTFPLLLIFVILAPSVFAQPASFSSKLRSFSASKHSHPVASQLRSISSKLLSYPKVPVGGAAAPNNPVEIGLGQQPPPQPQNAYQKKPYAERLRARQAALRNRVVSWKKVQGVDGPLVEIPTLFPGEYDTLSPALKTCLSDKHVAMIGFSLVRYQYLSLAYFMEYGKWLPWDGAKFRGYPSPVIENQWRVDPLGNLLKHHEHWVSFFNGTTALLNGNEACDCFRADECDASDAEPGWWTCCLENRYYRRSLSNRTGEKQVALTYLQSFGNKHNPRGHWFPQGPGPVEQTCPPGECGPPWNWSYRDAAAVALMLRPLDVTHFMWFLGLDPSYKSDQGAIPEVEHMAFAGTTVSRRGFNILYEGAYTSGTRGSAETVRAGTINSIEKQLTSQGWGNLDSLQIVQKLRDAFETKHTPLNNGQQGKDEYAAGTFFYWDDYHYYPWVYEELNKALLSLICGPTR
jgi:hypothetical protein